MKGIDTKMGEVPSGGTKSPGVESSLRTMVDGIKGMVGSVYNKVNGSSRAMVAPALIVITGSLGVGCTLNREGTGDLFPPGTGYDSGDQDVQVVEGGEDIEVTDAVWPEGAAGNDGGVDADAADDVYNEADVNVMDVIEEADAAEDVADAADEADAPEDAPIEADAPLDAPEEADAPIEAEAGSTCLTVNLQDMNAYTYALFNDVGNGCTDVVTSQYNQYTNGVTTFCIPEGKTYTLVLQVIDTADKNAAQMGFDYTGQVGPQSGIAAGGGNTQAMNATDAPLYCLAAGGSWKSVSDIDSAGNKAKFEGNVWSGGVTPPSTYFNFKITSP